MQKEHFKNTVPQSEEELTQFFRDNELLIHTAVKEFKSSGMEYDDLVQEANIGFMLGLRGFDPERGAQLSTYCYKCAQNQIRMLLRRNRSKGRFAFVYSIDAPYPSDEKDGVANRFDSLSTTNSDQLHTPEMALEDQVAQREMFDVAMAHAKDCLSENEYQALLMWYHNETQDTIAKALGVSQATTSKLIHYGHGKLKYYLQQKGYTDVL